MIEFFIILGIILAIPITSYAIYYFDKKYQKAKLKYIITFGTFITLFIQWWISMTTIPDAIFSHFSFFVSVYLVAAGFYINLSIAVSALVTSVIISLNKYIKKNTK